MMMMMMMMTMMMLTLTVMMMMLMYNVLLLNYIASSHAITIHMIHIITIPTYLTLERADATE